MFNKLVLLSLASLALADSESFGLLVIRSGSAYQNTALALSNGEFVAGSSSNYITASITDDGELKLSDGSYAVVGTDDITTGTTGSTSWSISSGYLAYNGGQAFSISDSGVVSVGSTGSTTYAVAAYGTNGYASDFTPSGSSSNSTNVTSSSVSSSATTFSTQTVNGAALKSVGFGAVLAAGAALLI